MRLRLAIALVVIAVGGGCRKSAPPPSADAASQAAAPVDTANAPASEHDPLAPPVRALPETEDGGDNILIDTGSAFEPGAPQPAPPPAADPFDAAIASVRQSAVGCFVPLPPGEYAATIAVTVTPSGTATRVEITSGPDDPEVRKCLEAAASRPYPDSRDGRKLSIDVRVKG